MEPLSGNPKIAIVHDWLTVPGGAEEVLKEIYGLFPAPVYCSQFDASRIKFIPANQVHPTFLQRLPMSLKRHYIYAPLMPWAYSHLDFGSAELLLSDSHSFAHYAKKPPGALHICYYHTPARSLWVPEIDRRASSTWVRKLLSIPLKRSDLKASANPDVVLANSHTTADRIKRFYGREVDAVIYPPVDTGRWLQVPRTSDDEGIVYWGRLIPYKRVDLAIGAALRAGVKLHVVGSGPSRAALERGAGGSHLIQFHGRLEDSELAKLLSRCRAAVFPGYEDFGIVPVEAMAAGLPVVSLDAGGAGETVLDTCGIRFKEQTVECLAEALAKLNGRTFDAEHLRKHAVQFDRSVFLRRYSEAVQTAWEAHRSKRANP